MEKWSNERSGWGHALSRLLLGTDSGVASAPRDTEQGRELLQGRLTQLSRLNAGLSSAFLLFDLLMLALTDLPGARALSAAHVFAVAFNFFLWLYTRRVPRRPGQLWAVDLIANWGNCAAFIAAASLLPLWARPELVQLLCVNLILGLRAFLVPSSPGRTFALGTLPVLAVVATTQARHTVERLHPDAPPALTMSLVIGAFGVAILIVTTLTSHTIFGLRERVREAFQLGQYTLLEKIGEGGMGIVYKASHAMLRRPTAIKLLPPERAGAHNLARFEREVQLTSALTHPNTVSIYDYGRSAEGQLYYAMEYLDGLDLESLVALDGPQDPGRVVHILLQVCGSLAEAHELGLIHRDVKPGNILLCTRGGLHDIAKVVDFGLVKELVRPANGVTHSMHNQIVGTPLYMSPEAIARPTELTAASDLYALGAVAFFLLVGHPPFEGASVVEICGHHLHTPAPSPSDALGRALPPELEQIVVGCLAKEPGRRPASAHELADQLATCGVAGWSRARARDWWAERSDAIAALKQRATTPKAVASTHPVATVAIDLRARPGAPRDAWHSGSVPDRERDATPVREQG